MFRRHRRSLKWGPQRSHPPSSTQTTQPAGYSLEAEEHSHRQGQRDQADGVARVVDDRGQFHTGLESIDGRLGRKVQTPVVVGVVVPDSVRVALSCGVLCVGTRPVGGRGRESGRVFWLMNKCPGGGESLWVVSMAWKGNNSLTTGNFMNTTC